MQCLYIEEEIYVANLVMKPVSICMAVNIMKYGGSNEEMKAQA